MRKSFKQPRTRKEPDIKATTNNRNHAIYTTEGPRGYLNGRTKSFQEEFPKSKEILTSACLGCLISFTSYSYHDQA
ncbi:hypothetical protein O181_039220 [Austropuccinia psidii MF-1]|uniref:Uncharacterized protein n=1 Tax=Austropuccinia psidii MF-1 TaxID=1389203 RepID=A0A9Q3DEH2_9BASI|nr:hypothetical protein [Austropuccinia psidii MF-1]